MESNRLELFLKTLGGWNIDTQLLKRDGSNLQLTDHELRKHLYVDFPYREIGSRLNKLVKSDTLVCKTDEFLLSYYFLRIPEKYITDDDSFFLCIGPFSTVRRNRDEICSIMARNNIPAKLFSDMAVFYDTIPVIDDSVNLDNIILHLASGIFHRDFHLERLPEDAFLFLGSNRIIQEVKDNPELASTSITERYRAEDEMMEAIAAADYDRAQALAQKLLNFQIRPRAKNPVRNKQHLVVILNTLCRKAAETGGVHPLYIDELSTRFAVLINEITSISDLNALSREMIHKYCLLVQNHAMKGYSPVVKEIVSFIDFHYAEDLTLNFLAQKYNIAKTYLSNLFKKETDTTLTDFIHHVRMRKAITLINSSSIPVSDIAYACGYNDTNYFIRIFKRTYGISPKQYQKTIVHAGR